jgi:Hemerythrin HHE cation binding domain
LKFQIPQPMIAEHEELHSDLKKAIDAGGKVGEAAKVVADILHPHFEREEKFALPPLGLLSALAKGKIEPEMDEVFMMTDNLVAELPSMLEEHQSIVAALEKLKEAAKQENKPEVVRFAEKLVLHAQTEEQVSYPTAILIGEYLKLKLVK